jgi:hypothetical protein
MAELNIDHDRLTSIGWSYRTNDRGWLIYRDPRTGRWHDAPEAMAIIEGKTISQVAA